MVFHEIGKTGERREGNSIQLEQTEPSMEEYYERIEVQGAQERHRNSEPDI